MSNYRHSDRYKKAQEEWKQLKTASEETKYTRKTRYTFAELSQPSQFFKD